MRYTPFSLSSKAWTLRRLRGSSSRYLLVSRYFLRARATPSAASANPLRALNTPAALAAHSKPCALRLRSTTRMHSLLLSGALPSLSSSSVPLATPRVCSTSTPTLRAILPALPPLFNPHLQPFLGYLRLPLCSLARSRPLCSALSRSCSSRTSLPSVSVSRWPPPQPCITSVVLSFDLPHRTLGVRPASCISKTMTV